MADGEQAVMDKIRRRAGEGPEVVCIIRDRNNPQAQERSHHVGRRVSRPSSTSFTRAGQPQNIPTPTSLEVPKRPTPILEWDKETGWLHQGALP